MPTRWNAWTHLQEVRFDYEKASNRDRCACRVRRSSLVNQFGSACRVVEVEAIIAAIDAGVMTVKIKRTSAKVESPPHGANTSRPGRRAPANSSVSPGACWSPRGEAARRTDLPAVVPRSPALEQQHLLRVGRALLVLLN